MFCLIFYSGVSKNSNENLNFAGKLLVALLMFRKIGHRSIIRVYPGFPAHRLLFHCAYHHSKIPDNFIQPVHKKLYINKIKKLSTLSSKKKQILSKKQFRIKIL